MNVNKKRSLIKINNTILNINNGRRFRFKNDLLQMFAKTIITPRKSNSNRKIIENFTICGFNNFFISIVINQK